MLVSTVKKVKDVSYTTAAANSTLASLSCSLPSSLPLASSLACLLAHSLTHSFTRSACPHSTMSMRRNNTRQANANMSGSSIQPMSMPSTMSNVQPHMTKFDILLLNDNRDNYTYWCKTVTLVLKYKGL